MYMMVSERNLVPSRTAGNNEKKLYLPSRSKTGNTFLRESIETGTLSAIYNIR